MESSSPGERVVPVKTPARSPVDRVDDVYKNTYAPIVGDAGPSTGRAAGGASVEVIYRTKHSGKSRDFVGTSYGGEAVWATVTPHERYA